MSLSFILDKGLTFGLSFAGAQVNAQVTILLGVTRELVEAAITGTFDFIGLLASFLGVWLALA